jgi:hypothetical protein
MLSKWHCLSLPAASDEQIAIMNARLLFEELRYLGR